MIGVIAAVLMAGLPPAQAPADTIRVYCLLDPSLASRIEHEDGALSAEQRQKRQAGSILDTLEEMRKALRETTVGGPLEVIDNPAGADLVVTLVGRAYYFDGSHGYETVWASVTGGRLFAVAFGINLDSARKGWATAAAAAAHDVADWIKRHRPEIVAQRKSGTARVSSSPRPRAVALR